MTVQTLDKAAAVAAPEVPEDADQGTQCPFCHTTVPAAASVCSGCGAQKTIRGAQAPFQRLFLWLTVFGTLWVFCGFAVIGPWKVKESGIRESSVQGCVQEVRRDVGWQKRTYFEGEERYLTVAEVPCRQVRDVRAAVAMALEKDRKEHPQSTYKLEGRPYTKTLLRAATSGEKNAALLQRFLISAAGLVVLIFGTWLAAKLWRSLFGRASDPVWLR